MTTPLDAKNETIPRAKYPKFVLVGLMHYGPHIWTFDNAREVAEHLWGQHLPHFALFRDRESFPLKGGEFEEMVKRLGGAEE